MRSPEPALNAPDDTQSARAYLELLYEIGREFAAALDLRTVLHRVLFLSMKNVGAVNGSILVLDEHGEPVESAFLLSGGQVHDHTTLQLRLTYERGLAGLVGRSRQAVLISDTSKDERWLRRPDDEQGGTGPKSAVSAPILARDELVGVITLVHPKPGFFTADHLDLVQAIADRAAIVILNARLYYQSQRQAQVMTAVAESAAVITASLDLDEVLQRILVQISQALRAEGVWLALLNPAEKVLEWRIAKLPQDQELPRVKIPLGQGIIGWAASQAQELIVPDLTNHPHFNPQVDLLPDVGSKHSDRRAMLVAPIQASDELIGVLCVTNPVGRAFESNDLLVLKGIGSMAGTAIIHAQLFETVQAAQSRYHELFEDSIDPILVTDWQGTIIETNRQAEMMIGLDAATLRSLKIGIVHNLDAEKIGASFSNLMGGRLVSYESQVFAHSSSEGALREIPVQVYVHSIQNNDPALPDAASIQWILRDLTERKGLDHMRDDLIAMVYHDLRSPLTNVVSSLDVLSSMPLEEFDPSMRSLVNIAIRSAERVQRLTNSLLDLSRLEAGQPLGNRQVISPLLLIEDALDAVASVARTKKLQLSATIGPASPDSSAQDVVLPDLDVDADMIRRVLVNLLENAVKFTPVDGAIQIGARHQENLIEMWVKDTGPGISPEDQERIFDKYTRLDLRGGPRGSGLGLAFCRFAVVAHGGTIWVESSPGEGACFRFSLPVIAHPAT